MRDAIKDKHILICNCERTMSLDADALTKVLDLDEAPFIHHQLCRAQIDLFERACSDDKEVVVCCTQEAALFQEVAEEKGGSALSFVNIRERAGWCDAPDQVHPKIAALVAEASVNAQPTRSKTVNSEGSCLVYGRGQTAFEAAQQLSGRLEVSLMLLNADDIIPPSLVDVPIHMGRIKSVSGALGGFDVKVDGYATMVPSSRQEMQFAMPRDGVSTQCDIILDLSGDAPLVSSAERRDGYLRADPEQPVSVAQALFNAVDLVGEFEKPLYVSYDASICAHGRSGKVGCSNCLDNCPVSAITPIGDHVLIDESICGGCGNCSASCPTGAVSYDYPAPSTIIKRGQKLLSTYINAGGEEPILLLHDDSHGGELISMMARFGRGLPVNVLPLSVYSPLMIGHDVLSAVLTAGARQIYVMVPPDRGAELAALQAEVALTNSLLDGFGFQGTRVEIIDERDPDLVEEILYRDITASDFPAPTTLGFVGTKREIARTALMRLADQSTVAEAAVISLPEGAPYGRIEIDTEGCTLCLACVGSCPAGALSDSSERPEVRFTESACVQCGLCKATCPEKVISLTPQFNLSDEALRPRELNGEDPFECLRCGTPFGSKSTVERIVKELEGKHWMFASSEQSDLIKMCDDCRVIARMEGQDAVQDPFAKGERPMVRTTEDYLEAVKKAAESGGDPDDYLN